METYKTFSAVVSVRNSAFLYLKTKKRHYGTFFNWFNVKKSLMLGWYILCLVQFENCV